MLARLKGELAYFNGIRRALARTTPIGKNPTRTFCDLAEELAAQYGDRVALISDRETFSYEQWNGRANRYARWALSQGYKKGDVVALLMPNRPEYLSIWLGLARAGLTTALINTNLSGAGLAHSINISAAKALIVEATLAARADSASAQFNGAVEVNFHGAPPGDPGAAPRIDALIDGFSDAALSAEERAPLTIQDAALYVFTSGTTGLPKAASLKPSMSASTRGAALGSPGGAPWKLISTAPLNWALALPVCAASEASTMSALAAEMLMLWASPAPERFVLIRAVVRPARARPSQIERYSGRLGISRATTSPFLYPFDRAQRA